MRPRELARARHDHFADTLNSAVACLSRPKVTKSKRGGGGGKGRLLGAEGEKEEKGEDGGRGEGEEG